MTYYMAINGQQVGPIEESEMLGRGITPATLVWRQGWEQWRPAGQVPELAYLFNQAPPQIPYQQPVSQPPYGGQQPYGGATKPPMPKTWLVESILITLFCCLPLGIVSIIKAASVSSLYSSGDYSGAAEASKQAGKWVKWGVIAGIILYVIYAISYSAYLSWY